MKQILTSEGEIFLFLVKVERKLSFCMDGHESFFNQNETETGAGRCKVTILLSYNKPIGVGREVPTGLFS